MHGRQPVVVGLECRPGLGCRGSCQTAPPCRTLKPFSTLATSPRSQATILPANRPSGAGSVHNASLYGAVEARTTGAGPAPSVMDAPVSVNVPVGPDHGERRLECSFLGRGRSAGQPWAHVVDGALTRAVVPGRGGYEYSRCICVQEGQLNRVRVGIGPSGDREVDHVDAVFDPPTDGRHGVGLEATLRPAHLVHSYVRAGSDAVDGAAVDPEHDCIGDRRTACGGRGMRAVSIAVPRCRVHLPPTTAL